MATNFPIARSKLQNYDDPTTSLKFKFKQINSEYKAFSDDLQKFLLNFFSSNAYPKKSGDEAMFYFANKLGSNLIKFISERQSEAASDSEISKHKIDGKTLDSYIADIFSKDIDKINAAIDGYTFTEKELHAFKKEVLKGISDAIEQSFDAAKKNLLKGDSSAASKSEAVSKLFQKHKGLFTSQNIYLPKIDFEKVNLFLKNGAFKKFSTESKAYASKLAEKSNRKMKGDVSQMSDSEIFALKMKEIGQRLKENKTVKRINEIKEQFLSSTIPSFRELHFRLGRFEQRLEKLAKFDLKKSLKAFGQKMAAKLKIAIAFVFPISEVLFLAKAAYAVIRFSLKTINYVYSSFKKILWFVAKIGKTALHILGKSLNVVYQSAKFAFTSKIFRAFFSTYVGAYVLGYGIGFIYGKLKKYFAAAKEFYDKAKKTIADIYGEHSEEIEDLKRRVSEFSLSMSNSLMAVGYTTKDFAERLFNGEKIDEALKNSLNDIKSGKTGASLGIGTDLEQISEAVVKFFNPTYLKTIFDAAKSSIASGAAHFLGGVVGGYIGGLLGSAILGPFGTVPGALLGSFVGDYLVKYLYPNAHKVKSVETEYQEHLRTSFGRVTEFSSVGEFDLGKSSIKSKFDEIYRKSLLGESLEDDKEFLEKYGMTIEEGSLTGALEGMNAAYEVSNRLVTQEINIASDMLRELKNKKNFSDEENNRKARTSLLKLFSGRDEFQDSDFNESARLALIYRIYRAIAIGNLIPRLYGGEISEDQFLQSYRDLDKPKIGTKTYEVYSDTGEILQRSYQTILFNESLIRDNTLANNLTGLIANSQNGMLTQNFLKTIAQTLNAQEYGFGISTKGIYQHYLGDDRSLGEIVTSKLGKIQSEIEIRNTQTLDELQKQFEDLDDKNNLPTLQAIQQRLIVLNRNVHDLKLTPKKLEEYQILLGSFNRTVNQSIRNLASMDSGKATEN